MSLDTVELVISIEERFDISIPDGEAAQLHTIQEIADCVHSKIAMNPTAKCKSQLLFYLLRRYFQDQFGIDRDSFMPQRIIRDLLANHDLKSAWRSIQRDLQLELPRLVARDLDPSIPAQAKILGFKAYWRPKPVTDGSVAELVNWILSMNHKKLVDVKDLLSKKDVESIIMGIVSERSGIDVNELKLTHSITDDLGMD